MCDILVIRGVDLLADDLSASRVLSGALARSKEGRHGHQEGGHATATEGASRHEATCMPGYSKATVAKFAARIEEG